ncbi:hypothetical protein BDY21DRAFT_364068 [Lineolata rhizophorae]|uniref:Proteophosphoglycan 5 n=1 Tax=Lineolata rhizophorae TaxID=578093 RepID=A0A6A6NZH6_9PEZI|nr:hypothetical protein BDY21DRAFT_364068 [Lineolata rhizophorae]
MPSPTRTPPPSRANNRSSNQNSKNQPSNPQSNATPASNAKSSQRRQRNNRNQSTQNGRPNSNNTNTDHRPSLPNDQPANGSAASDASWPFAADESTAMHDDICPTTTPKRNNRGGRRQKNNSVSNFALPPKEDSGPKAAPQEARATSIPGLSTLTPAKQQAYAGPTFHASPAPSALPVPKFFSKSVPGDSTESPMQARLENDQEKSPPESSSSSSSSNEQPSCEVRAKEESPLDFFFKADREEKAKKQNNNAATPESRPANRLPPNSEPALGVSTPNSYPRHHSRHPSSASGKEVFMLELDGNSGENNSLSGPAPSFHERIAASRSVTAPQLPHERLSGPVQEKEYNQTLKDMLSSLPNQSRAGPATGPRSDGARTPQQQQQPGSNYYAPSPFYNPFSQRHPQRSNSGPSTPVPHAHGGHSLHIHAGPIHMPVDMSAGKRTSNLRKELSAPDRVELPGSSVKGNEPAKGLGAVSEMPANNNSKNDNGSSTKAAATNPLNNFLNAHSRSAGSTPELPLQHPTETPRHPAGTQTVPSPNNASGSASPSRAGQGYPDMRASRDIKTMENDLRRLLNLNIMSGAGTTNA